MPSASSSPRLLTIAVAAMLPPLLAYNQTPAATLYNQLLAIAAWGAMLVVFAGEIQGWISGLRTPSALALALLLPAPVAAMALWALPASLALGAVAVMGAALAVLLVAQGLPGHWRAAAGEALCWGLLMSGLVSIGICLVQVFAPSLADGQVLARSGIVGRAVSNLRQPNHLASLMMWTAVAAVFLAELHRWRLTLAVLLMACMFTVVLSASRTGYIGVGILLLWGALDRRLTRHTRLALAATPVMLAASWGLMSIWAAQGEHAFGAASRLSEGAGSPARIAILRDAWALIKANPWWGVGWGEFNVAWSLTPFPDRPIAFFDHTHNLPAQLVVELGWPWAGVILVLLGWALWAAFRSAARAREPQDALLRRCAFMIVLMIGLHSLLEYPLWYAYFLLPTAFAWGLALPARPDPVKARGSLTLALFGALLVAATAFAAWDYRHRIVVIYAPEADSAPLLERIQAGQRSLLFSHMADYAAATSLEPGPEALAAARRTAFSLVDARLLMHWSQSLEATGRLDEARFLADRAREFHNPATAAWLAECKRTPAAFQCQRASEVADWRRLR